jgi:putative ABC transport system permease protein
VANLVVRTDGRQSAASIRAVLESIDPDLPVGSLHDLEGTVTETVSRRRFALVVTMIFGGSAVVLSLLGLGALMSQLVSYRKHEIGVRIALGAQRRHVLGIVVLQGVGIVAAGIVAGVGGALAGTRLLSGLLYGVSATDPMSFFAVPAAMVAVAALACAHPATRAMRSDPMLALRGN